MDLSSSDISGRDPRKIKVGTFLRERRHRKGLSLRDIARRLDVTHSAIGQIERGETLPKDAARLSSLADALDLTSEDRATVFEYAGYSLSLDTESSEAESRNDVANSSEDGDPDFLQYLFEDSERAFQSGDYPRSTSYAKQIVRQIHRSRDSTSLILYSRANILLARTFNLQDRPSEALRAAHEAQRAAQRAGNLPLEIESTHVLGVVTHKVKLDEGALDCYSHVYNRMDRRSYPELSSRLLLRDVVTAQINVRRFDEFLYDTIDDGIDFFDKVGDVSGFINYRELKARALAKERRLRAAAAEIQDLWDSTTGTDLTYLERLRLLVTLLNVLALQGDRVAAEQQRAEILSLIEVSQLYGQRSCLLSIGGEVAQYHNDARWRTWLAPVT